MTDELTDQMVARTEELTEEKKGGEAVAEATELSQLDPKDAIVWFVKGKAHYVASEFEQALACFSKAAELDKENPQIWHMMGYALISLNRLSEAEEALAYVKATDAINSEAVCALGICQVMQNKPEEARKNFEAALNMDKPITMLMLEHFHDKFFSVSKETQSRTKAMIERILETIKLVR
ncbi:TPA: tetratricopeptide repeat protein [Candidatus Micrarchaeota archaeon]|nr:tetratricopeptide repeat protein [Candidatus Micrarchaeota archaeon]